MESIISTFLYINCSYLVFIGEKIVHHIPSVSTHTSRVDNFWLLLTFIIITDTCLLCPSMFIYLLHELLIWQPWKLTQGFLNRCVWSNVPQYSNYLGELAAGTRWRDIVYWLCAVRQLQYNVQIAIRNRTFLNHLHTFLLKFCMLQFSLFRIKTIFVQIQINKAMCRK